MADILSLRYGARLALVVWIAALAGTSAHAEYYATAMSGTMFGKLRTIVSIKSSAAPYSVIDGLSLIAAGPEAGEAAEKGMEQLDNWVVERGYLGRGRFARGSATHRSVLAEGVKSGVASVVGVVGGTDWNDIEFVLRADTRGDGEAERLPMEIAGDFRILPPKDSPVPPDEYLDGMVELKRFYKGREVDPVLMELGIAWGELSGILARGRERPVRRSVFQDFFVPPLLLSHASPVYEYVIRCDRAAARIYARLGFEVIPEERLQREKPAKRGGDVYMSLSRAKLVERVQQYIRSDLRVGSGHTERSLMLTGPRACNNLFGSLVGDPNLVRHTPLQIHLSQMFQRR